jgi:hypothetical protein
VKEDNGQSWVPIVWDEAVFGVELKLWFRFSFHFYHSRMCPRIYLPAWQQLIKASFGSNTTDISILDSSFFFPHF